MKMFAVRYALVLHLSDALHLLDELRFLVSFPAK